MARCVDVFGAVPSCATLNAALRKEKKHGRPRGDPGGWGVGVRDDGSIGGVAVSG